MPHRFPSLIMRHGHRLPARIIEIRGGRISLQPLAGQHMVQPGLTVAVCTLESHELSLRQGVGFLLSSLKEQVPDRIEIFMCPRSIVIPGHAIPQGLLVELNALLANAAKYHSTDPAITDRQRLHPLRCRSLIPQLMILGVAAR